MNKLSAGDIISLLIKSTVLIIAFFDFFNRITKKELVFGKESKSKTTFNNKRNVYGDEIE